MARIRTVKPALFRHEELYELEIKTKLPLRIAWVGLFTVADREGRFEWKPRILKLDILPWDNVDFEKVLAAFVAAGFIQKYTVEGRTYGWIPSFKRHQNIRPDEAKSQIPPISDTDSTPTRNEPVTDSMPSEDVEGKGKEGKGITETVVLDFELVWKNYPRKVNKTEARRRFLELIKTESDFVLLVKAVKNYRDDVRRLKIDEKGIRHFTTFLGLPNEPKWRDWLVPEANGMDRGPPSDFDFKDSTQEAPNA